MYRSLLVVAVILVTTLSFMKDVKAQTGIKKILELEDQVAIGGWKTTMQKSESLINADILKDPVKKKRFDDAQEPGYNILRNDTECQVVYDPNTKLAECAFYPVGEVEIPEIGKVNANEANIFMMQKEAGSIKVSAANRYYENLKQLMALMRATFRKDDLPIVLGKISDSGNNDRGKIWKHGELIQYAQEKLATVDDNAAIVRTTRNYGYYDRAHYNSEGYIDLGVEFANAIYKMIKK